MQWIGRKCVEEKVSKSEASNRESISESLFNLPHLHVFSDQTVLLLTLLVLRSATCSNRRGAFLDQIWRTKRWKYSKCTLGEWPGRPCRTQLEKQNEGVKGINPQQPKVFGVPFSLREIPKIFSPLNYAILRFVKCLNYSISGFQRMIIFKILTVLN